MTPLERAEAWVTLAGRVAGLGIIIALVTRWSATDKFEPLLLFAGLALFGLADTIAGTFLGLGRGPAKGAPNGDQKG